MTTVGGHWLLPQHVTRTGFDCIPSEPPEEAERTLLFPVLSRLGLLSRWRSAMPTSRSRCWEALELCPGPFITFINARNSGCLLGGGGTSSYSRLRGTGEGRFGGCGMRDVSPPL